MRYGALRGANNHQVHLQQEAYQGVAHIIIIFASKILKFWTPENDDNIMMADHLEIGYYNVFECSPKTGTTTFILECKLKRIF